MKTNTIAMPEHFSVNEAASFREETYAQLKIEPILFELDFSRCKFIDSTGLGVLVGLYKKCAETGSSMVLKNVTPNVANILQMTRLNQVFTIR